ncbi:DUF2852 domain-containing protein [Paragemmobacter ruber]|uniref:DUF2852 domain-containing protein n=1 Tax=Paragemmobacter ruber TaxID=1985673 RepID=A0ABW9Y8B2_9RHOB|nr:DUF2852 domain-containing protein [Rhodobacter ruber]NBE08826.1 DUF2852 domain-containing protein [Rhodobacter ruber]
MNTSSTAARVQAYVPGGLLSWPRRAEAWLDGHGRKAWITAMVLGFIFFWPVGLALVAYMTMTNRWSKTMFGSTCRKSRRAEWGAHRVYASSGNSAFDAYKAETLRRLEDEQAAFEGFLNRLREAKDKQEFDAFMADRARTPRPGNDLPPPAEA